MPTRSPTSCGGITISPSTAIRSSWPGRRLSPKPRSARPQFNMLDFGDENARRAEAYREHHGRGQSADGEAAGRPQDRLLSSWCNIRSNAAGNMNIRQLALDKTITYGLQRRESANTYAVEARQAQAAIDAGAHDYNNVMLGGKWRGMMGIHPHDLPAYDSPHLPVWNNHGDKGCAWQTEGGGYFAGGGWPQRLPPFQRQIPRRRYLDFFVTGPVAAKWTLKPNAPWITLSQSSGKLGPKHLEQRVWIGIDWSKAPDGASAGIVASCGKTKAEDADHGAHVARQYGHQRLVPRRQRHRLHLCGPRGRDERGWEVLDGLGHTGASLRSDLDMASVDAADPAASRQGGTVRHLSLRNGGQAGLRLGAGRKGGVAAVSRCPSSRSPARTACAPRCRSTADRSQVLDFTAAEFTEAWRQHVLTNTAVAKVHDLELTPGAHTLTIYALDPGLILDRIEIAFDGAPARLWAGSGNKDVAMSELSRRDGCVTQRHGCRCRGAFRRQTSARRSTGRRPVRAAEVTERGGAPKGLHFGSCIGTGSAKEELALLPPAVLARPRRPVSLRRSAHARPHGRAVLHRRARERAEVVRGAARIPDKFDFRRADMLVDFAARQRTGGARPQSVLERDAVDAALGQDNYDFGSRPATAAETMLRDHIFKVCHRYGKRIFSYDVINETINPQDRRTERHARSPSIWAGTSSISASMPHEKPRLMPNWSTTTSRAGVPTARIARASSSSWTM